MGKLFLEEVALQHDKHLKMLEHERQSTVLGLRTSEEEQKCMPAYVWGLKLAEMCVNLEQVKTVVRGAGKIEMID